MQVAKNNDFWKVQRRQVEVRGTPCLSLLVLLRLKQLKDMACILNANSIIIEGLNMIENSRSLQIQVLLSWPHRTGLPCRSSAGNAKLSDGLQTVPSACISFEIG